MLSNSFTHITCFGNVIKSYTTTPVVMIKAKNTSDFLNVMADDKQMRNNNIFINFQNI